jgi:DNA-binding HxlR family transcriptional regulator
VDNVSRYEQARHLVELLDGRCTLAVLAELSEQGHRYPDLHDALEGISYKVFTDTLRRAERDGLITRRLDRERIESATLYELTDLGRSLDVPLGIMDRWVETNWPAVEAAHRHWDARSKNS